MEGRIEYPDLKAMAEKSTSCDELWEKYSKVLRRIKRAQGESQEEFQARKLVWYLYANKLEEFFSIVSGEENIEQLKKAGKKFKNFVKKWAKENNVEATFLMRIKDFIGINEKIRLYIRKGKSLDRILDLIGFRVIIHSDDEDLCYDLMNKVIVYFISEGCIPTQAEPNVDVGIMEAQRESGLDERFIPNVKDYIRFPKALTGYSFQKSLTGYRSLHVVMRTTKGLPFEIQIRTKEMDEAADDANHKGYKSRRYLGEEIYLEPEKLHIKGVKFRENAEKGIDPRDAILEDDVGFLRSKFLDLE